MLSQNHTKGVIEDAEDREKLTELILKAKQGDKEAFELVYTNLYTPLYRFVLSRSRNVQTTQDICQDTFMRFYEALPRYEPETHPLAYLFTIAKRLLINLSIKHKPVEIDEEMMATFSDENVSILDDAHIRLLAKEIETFLPQLSDDEGDVIRLHYFSELSHKEVASILGKEESHVRKLKERALKKLRILSNHLYEN